MTTDGRLELSDQFDRIVSVEMLEHIRNYQQMFKKIAGCCRQTARCLSTVGHRDMAYPFDDSTPNLDGPLLYRGQMPAKHLFAQFPEHLTIENFGCVRGPYARTCRAWLNNMDQHKKDIMPLFVRHMEVKHGNSGFTGGSFLWLVILFAFNKGAEWQVYHYQFCRTN